VSPFLLPVSPLLGLREGPEPPLTYLVPQTDMEDAHTTLLKLDEGSGNAFFAVFDGHGGAPLIICVEPKTASLISLIDRLFCGKIRWTARCKTPRQRTGIQGIRVRTGPEEGVLGHR
jgi:hypothetical protein